MIMKRKKLRRDNMIVRRVEERRDLNILYLVTPAALLSPCHGIYNEQDRIQ